MKNHIALILSLSLAFAHPTHCVKNSMEEWGVCGLGVLTAYTGLKMVNNATGKDGTKTQAVLGTALFGGGVYMTFAGPGKVKTFHRSNKPFAVGKKWKAMTTEARKKAAADALDTQIEREPYVWSQRALIVLRAAIAVDPTGQLAKTFPWSYFVRAHLGG